MAKRRKASTRRVYVKAKKSYRRTSNNPTALIIPAAVYGAIRAPLANALDPIMQKVPMGAIADELVLGLASYFAAKKGKGMVKKIGQVGLVVESARAGEVLISGQLMGVTTQKVGTIYNY